MQLGLPSQYKRKVIHLSMSMCIWLPCGWYPGTGKRAVTQAAGNYLERMRRSRSGSVSLSGQIGRSNRQRAQHNGVLTVSAFNSCLLRRCQRKIHFWSEAWTAMYSAQSLRPPKPAACGPLVPGASGRGPSSSWLPSRQGCMRPRMSARVGRGCQS